MYRDKGSTPVLRCGDRLPNFQDSRSDFARTDGKEAVNGFPARKSEEEEDADFQQKTNSILRFVKGKDGQISGIQEPVCCVPSKGRMNGFPTSGQPSIGGTIVNCGGER